MVKRTATLWLAERSRRLARAASGEGKAPTAESIAADAEPQIVANGTGKL
jgi:hypothetical protein